MNYFFSINYFSDNGYKLYNVDSAILNELAKMRNCKPAK
ncbi:hypothetical protein SAMN04488541_10822 [Thermoflexibacter ruber]|uniref:Uncharacterized protein n=1 Tax=Thermoflexibacter ruber TaxID=1003 RepID=A0A1I2K4D9_9BACT|nr:hypothetical protein SAMN04488541_10822 [Thermoflexibacter ruber]